MMQNRFKKILVPLDGSPNSIRGLNEAISLARQCNSTLMGVNVIPSARLFPREVYDSYVRYLDSYAKEYFNKAKKSAAQNGIDFQGKILCGNDTVEMIVRYAKVTRSDIIVIGSRGKGHPKMEYFGSVAFGVLVRSKLPVLIVK